MRIFFGVAMSFLVATTANAACVKPEGTYTGSAYLFAYINETGETARFAAQSTYVIPKSGDWKLYGVLLGYAVTSNYTRADASSKAEMALRSAAGVPTGKASQNTGTFPGINGTTNKFDTKLCQGTIKSGGNVFRYVVSNNGSTIQIGPESTDEIYVEQVFTLNRT